MEQNKWWKRWKVKRGGRDGTKQMVRMEEVEGEKIMGKGTPQNGTPQNGTEGGREGRRGRGGRDVLRATHMACDLLPSGMKT